MRINQQYQSNQGFSLIETLVCAFVLSVGLLGVTSMQAASIKVNQGAYHQSQANIIVQDILDRLRLNRAGFLAGEYDDADTDNTAPDAQICINEAAGCSTEKQALHDIHEFNGYFKGNSNGNFLAFIPGGRALISRDTTANVATVTVFWNEDEWTSSSTKESVTQQLSLSVRI